MEKPLDEGSSSLPEQPTREKTATERIVSIAVNFFMIIPFYSPLANCAIIRSCDILKSLKGYFNSFVVPIISYCTQYDNRHNCQTFHKLFVQVMKGLDCLSSACHGLRLLTASDGCFLLPLQTLSSRVRKIYGGLAVADVISSQQEELRLDFCRSL